MLAVKSNAESYRAEAEERRVSRSREVVVRSSERFNKLSMVLCVAVALGAMWVVCTKGALIYSLSYGNVKLQTQIQKMAADNATLTAQVDELERPSRILNVALGKLHMHYANPVRISGSLGGK
jgi:cell division protein FtsL